MPLPQFLARPHATLGLLAPASPLNEALADASLGEFQIDLQTGDARWSDTLFRLFELDPHSPTVLADAAAKVHVDDADALRDAFTDASTGEGAEAFAADFRVVRADGGMRWLSVRARRSPAGHAPASFAGVVVDRTELRVAHAEAATLEVRRDRFLALLAHDLRNPLAPLHTAAELMRRAEMQPARVVAISEMLSRQVRQMARLIDDLVDVSRASQGRIELDMQVLDLRRVVDDALAAIGSMVERRRQTVEARFAEGPLTVRADARRLSQVVIQLIDHASRSSTEGAVVRLSTAPTAQGVALSVTDAGEGIAPDRLAEAFELYPPADGDGTRRQTLGTGMALVKALVELHGGTVDVASAGVGQGATYTVRLPAAS